MPTRLDLATDHLRAARASLKTAAKLMAADDAPEDLVKLCKDVGEHITDVIGAVSMESIKRDTERHTRGRG